jgi:condensin complex subunit 2
VSNTPNRASPFKTPSNNKSRRRSSGSGTPTLHDISLLSSKKSVRKHKRGGSSKIAPLSNANIASLYSDCIKLATANKINQKNSWSLALIDHMDTMLKQEESQSGGHTNFQKASCTLDASVQIYSHRVDAVHKDMFKVLGGLTRSDVKDARKQNDDDDDSDNGVARKKRQSSRGAATLERNVSALNTKSLEVEVEVDPLFKKTCASFDEGGAHGLLLNRLCVTDGCQLVFDSTDVITNEDANTSDDEPSDSKAQSVEETEAPVCEIIDSSHLGDSLQSVWGQLDSLQLCPALDTMHELASLLKKRISGEIDALEPLDFSEHLLSGTSVQNDDFGFDYGGDDDDDFSGGFQFSGAGSGLGLVDDMDLEDAMYHEQRLNSSSAASKFDSVTNGAALQQGSNSALALKSASDEFSYLDVSTMSGWAGATHWKYRKTFSAAAALSLNPADADDDSNASTTGRKRQRKQTFYLDFTSGEEVNETAFDPPKRSNSCLSDAAIDKSQNTDNLLPEDVHFTVRRLQALFTRPHLLMRMRARAGANAIDAETGEDRSAELFCIAEDSLAAQGAERRMNVGAFGNDGGDDDDDDDDDNTQHGAGFQVAQDFMAIDDDIGYDGMDAVPVGDVAEEHKTNSELDGNDTNGGYFDNMNLIDRPDIAQKIDIGYAKFSKQVDVKALKTGLWSTLSTQFDESKDKSVSASQANDVIVAAGKADEANSFSSTLKNLSTNSTLPKATAENISVPYCFICLLHLANEKELEFAPVEAPTNGVPGLAVDFAIRQ